MAESDTTTPIIPHKDPSIGTGEAQAARAPNPLLRFLKILGPVFTSMAEAEWHVFKLRWKLFSGEDLPLG